MVLRPFLRAVFNQLAKLHVVGRLPVLKDLIHRITWTKLEDISVTFNRLSYDELKVSLAKEMAEWERRAEESRRREEADEKLRALEKMLKDDCRSRKYRLLYCPP